MKTDKIKNLVLETLREMPIVQFACNKASIGRTTYYRWRESKEFAQKADKAIADGEALITDMTESQLISLIRDRNFQAVQLWLRHHHQKYGNKIEVTGNLNIKDEPLTSEQEELVGKALEQAGLLQTNLTEENYEQNESKSNQQNQLRDNKKTPER